MTIYLLPDYIFSLSLSLSLFTRYIYENQFSSLPDRITSLAVSVLAAASLSNGLQIFWRLAVGPGSPNTCHTLIILAEFAENHIWFSLNEALCFR